MQTLRKSRKFYAVLVSSGFISISDKLIWNFFNFQLEKVHLKS